MLGGVVVYVALFGKRRRKEKILHYRNHPLFRASSETTIGVYCNIEQLVDTPSKHHGPWYMDEHLHIEKLHDKADICSLQ